MVCDFIEHGGDTGVLRERFANATSPGFDFDRDLVRVGIANQTTMLSGESLAIAEEVRQSMVRRHGDAAGEHFRSFDTICSATQERQDAVVALLDEPLDVMIVVGGYNSSNTCHLAALVHSRGVRVFHIEDADAVDPETGSLRHQPIGAKQEVVTEHWLGEARSIGITAGASTPNNKIGETVARICRTAGVDLGSVIGS
jgi:4-hydroxy-3-methylbut-2-enyl diphosphate reductase